MSRFCIVLQFGRSSFFLPKDGWKRRPTSLASFDISLLRAWFAAQHPSPTLTVFLHEFERFDINVVQDVFYITRYAHSHVLPIII